MLSMFGVSLGIEDIPVVFGNEEKVMVGEVRSCPSGTQLQFQFLVCCCHQLLVK